MTGQVLARVLMWGIIIGMVWYFSQQYRNSSPTPEQEQAMWEAARHYSEYSRQSESGTVDNASMGHESDLPKPED